VWRIGVEEQGRRDDESGHGRDGRDSVYGRTQEESMPASTSTCPWSLESLVPSKEWFHFLLHRV
jgi:hypothetical protein